MISFICMAKLSWIIFIFILLIAGTLTGCYKDKAETDSVANETGNITLDLNKTNETGIPKEYCGDQVCNLNETECTCPGDCGNCTGAEETCREWQCFNDQCLSIPVELCCGNRDCEEGESPTSCSIDCSVLDLSDYPEPFISGGRYNCYKIVTAWQEFQQEKD
jgi:hypothetical protein